MIIEDGCCSYNNDSPKDFAPIEVLSKEENGQHDRKWSFQVEQQGTGNRGEALESPQHQDRSKDSAGHHDSSQQPSVRGLDWCLTSRNFRVVIDHQFKAQQPDSGAEIQQARNEQRSTFWEQQFCYRETDPEEGCCC